MKALDNLKNLLDQQYSGSFDYLFKFIVPIEQEIIIKEMLKGNQFEQRTSKNGKYLSISFKKHVKNSKEVIDLYQRLSVISGIVSL